MKLSILTAALCAIGLISAQARTWTSADGSKTFEGDFRSYNESTGIVQVITNGRLLNVPQDKLSSEDIEWIKSEGMKAAAPASAEPSGAVGMEVAKAKLQRLDGNRFKSADLTKDPEFYIFYYSASW